MRSGGTPAQTPLYQADLRPTVSKSWTCCDRVLVHGVGWCAMLGWGVAFQLLPEAFKLFQSTLNRLLTSIQSVPVYRP